MNSMAMTHETVREYYGRILKDRDDLKTGACCCADAPPAHLRDILRQIEPEICERFYGCGSPIPAALQGRTVLDLGCGTGRDAYVVSKLVGETGKVIGVDMTEEQLAVARRHVDAQTERFGYGQPNVEFVHGYIEDLVAAGIADGSVDVVISNCVLNLSPDKRRVFEEIFRVLAPGGELHFSDVFASRRIPRELRDDPVLRGECLGGAMYVEDFRRLLGDLGCPDYRVVAQQAVALNDREVVAKIGHVDFHSLTVRAFKLADLEDICEDYGQVATYRGTITESPHAYVFDDHHVFERDKPVLVCGNTAAMLQDSRLAEHFEVRGDRSVHYGAFGCGELRSGAASDDEQGGSCC